ncbi:MAG TPA: hypothetical protein VJT75_01175 [Thermoleophilaceae bacterium]|nr:hypothetical protein [Thermoleophilaceae bacterium]
MEVLAVHHVPSLTQERYETVIQNLMGGRRQRFESMDDLPFTGLLVHAAAQTDDGFVIFDVFESQEAFDRFSEEIRPFASGAGIEEGPKPWPIHTFVWDR